MSNIGVVAAATGGLEQLTDQLLRPLTEQGHSVAVTLTPTAYTWLVDSGDTKIITDMTGYQVRSEPRLPTVPSPHPPIDLYIAAPLSANSTAKLALGIADNQALTVLCENIATTPMIIFPRVNAAHTRQPAWQDHLARLRSCPTVDLLCGDDIWPLHEPRQAGPRQLPWPAIIDTTKRRLTAPG